MADHKQVRIRVLRRYWRGGNEYDPGAVIAVPEYALEAVLGARPPFGEVVDPSATVSMPEPELDTDFDATEGALDLARSIGFDLAPFRRQGSGPGGRIYKADVEAWAGVED